jgi:hypothetical protein
MGIRFFCPNGHRLNVKEFQAGRKGICPFCGSKIQIPTQSTRKSSKEEKAAQRTGGGAEATMQAAGAATAVASAGVAGGEAAWPAASLYQPSAGEPATLPSIAFSSVPMQPGVQPGPLPSVFPSSPVQPAPYQAQPLAVAPLQSAPIQSAPMQSAPAASLAPTPSTPSAPDPLTEAGDAVWYVRPPSGGQFGPAGRDIMRGWLGEGRISADALVWREGWRDWQTAGQVFAQLAGQGLQAFQGIGPAAASSGLVTASGYRPAAKRQSKKTQVVVIGVLIAVVLILLIVFVVILLGGDRNTSGRGSPSEPRIAAYCPPLPSARNHWPPCSRRDHEDSAVPSAPRNCVQSVCG